MKTWYQNRRTKWKQVNIPFLDGLDILGTPPINPPSPPMGFMKAYLFFNRFSTAFCKKKEVWKRVDFMKHFHKNHLFLIDGFPCQALKIYEMGFLCWCNVKVKKILQEEATKRKQAELNHNFWKSVVFKIFAAKSSWKNEIRDEGSTALYTAHTAYTV